MYFMSVDVDGFMWLNGTGMLACTTTHTNGRFDLRQGQSSSLRPAVLGGILEDDDAWIGRVNGSADLAAFRLHVY